MHSPPPTRRDFLRGGVLSLAALAGVPLLPRAVFAARSDHPVPRAGITGARVLSAAQLKDRPDLVPLFDAIRGMPAIADGIRCNCGCAGMPGYYSLLSCYEGDGMAQACPICEGEGRLVTRLGRAGKTLAEIRAAVDAQFG